MLKQSGKQIIIQLLSGGGSLGGPSNLVEFDLECVLYKCMRNKKSLLDVEVILTEITVPCTCMYNDESLFVKKKIYPNKIGEVVMNFSILNAMQFM